MSSREKIIASREPIIAFRFLMSMSAKPCQGRGKEELILRSATGHWGRQSTV